MRVQDHRTQNGCGLDYAAHYAACYSYAVHCEHVAHKVCWCATTRQAPQTHSRDKRHTDRPRASAPACPRLIRARDLAHYAHLLLLCHLEHVGDHLVHDPYSLDELGVVAFAILRRHMVYDLRPFVARCPVVTLPHATHVSGLSLATSSRSFGLLSLLFHSTDSTGGCVFSYRFSRRVI